jgi:hypothetical protein
VKQDGGSIAMILTLVVLGSLRVTRAWRSVTWCPIRSWPVSPTQPQLGRVDVVPDTGFGGGEDGARGEMGVMRADFGRLV